MHHKKEMPYEPKLSATPQDRRKLFVLSVLAGIVIILFWIATLPMNFKENGDGPGPIQFFTRISEQLTTAGAALDVAQTANDAANTN